MGKHKDKEIKTNAMRLLDNNHVAYDVNYYECSEFIDGIHIADQMGQSYETSFKTLVTVGRTGNYYVFALPVDKELDLKKAAKSVEEKSVELLPVKEINAVTGYIRGGCTPIGMKKQYRTVIHKSAAEFERIIISGGKLGIQIILNPEDLRKVTKGKYDDIIMEAI